MNYDICCFPKCRQPHDLIYLDKLLCNKHWGKICDEYEKNRDKENKILAHIKLVRDKEGEVVKLRKTRMTKGIIDDGEKDDNDNFTSDNDWVCT